MKNGKFLWSGIALRAAGILTLALVLMLTACPSPNDDGDKGADKSALNSAIADANAAKTGVSVSADGADLAVGTLWVTQAVWDAFDAAISAANEVKSSGSADQAQVDAATATLKAAITAFNNAKRTKTLTDISALTAKITEAEIAMASAIVAANATGVANGERWATNEQAAALNTAIAAAKNAGAAIDQATVDAAVIALNTALTTFNNAVSGNPPGEKTSDFTQKEFDNLKARATTAIAGVTVSANGDDVPPSDKWVTQAVKDAMDSAITAATALSDAAYLALSGALTTFNAAQQPGTTPDTAARQTALESADAAKVGVVIAVNSAGASKGSAWVTQAQWDALNTAYTAVVNTVGNADTTKNAVDLAISALNTAVTTFNAAKTANGLGTKEETAGSLTISGLEAVYKNGTSIMVALLNVKYSEEDENAVTSGTGTITNGALTVSVGNANGSYYIAFTSDNKVVFISKEKAAVSGGTASIAYTDIELYIWSVKLNDLGLTTPKPLDAFLLEATGNMNGGPYNYAGWKQGMVLSGWFGNEYVNLDFLNIAFYKDAACAQEYSGSDTVEPDKVVYAKFSLGNKVENEPTGDKRDLEFTFDNNQTLMINPYGRGDGHNPIDDEYTWQAEGRGTFPVGVWVHNPGEHQETLTFTATKLERYSPYFGTWRYNWKISGNTFNLTNGVYIPSQEDWDELANYNESSFRAERPWIPATSTIDPKMGSLGVDYQIVDHPVMTPFVNDSEAIGVWTAVNFVNEIDHFDPTAIYDPWWTGIEFISDGTIKTQYGDGTWGNSGTWTKGLISNSSMAPEYEIKTVSGTAYLFVQWKSGDYSVRGRKPSYYVFKK
jgi:hypothetical protein